MNTRLIDNSADYPVIAPWFAVHGMDVVPLSVLPPVGVAAIADDGTPLAAVWLYMALGVGVAWMCWAVTNPAVSPQCALSGLQLAIGAVEKVAIAHDYHLIYTETNRPSLVRWFKARGFKANHSDVTQLIKHV